MGEVEIMEGWTSPGFGNGKGGGLSWGDCCRGKGVIPRYLICILFFAFSYTW